MLEVEMKFPLDDPGPLLERLAAWNARDGGGCEHADSYFNAPDRDFGRTDEALRIRRIGTVNCLTYKGSKRDSQTKTRTEIEVPFEEGTEAAERLAALLRQLGYRPTAVVRKQRRTYHLDWEGRDVAIGLDEVDELGRFVELEIVTTESQLDACRSSLLRLAEALDLSPSERRSYLEMLLTAREKKP